MKEVEEIRNKLRDSSTNYKECKLLRKRLNEIAKQEYKQEFSDKEHIDFMERNLVSFDINHPQSTNFPFYYTMFSVVTQHLRGDSIRELLDRGIYIENF